MIAKLDEPRIVADVISILSELVAEVKLQFDSQGMSIIAIDPANVALVSFKIPASAFSQFVVEKEILGLNLDNLKAVLKRCSPGSSLIMQTEDNTLRIDVHDRIKRRFVLALIDIDAEEKSVPPLDFTTSIDINSGDLIDSIEDCAIVADSCSFITKDNKFIIEAKGLNSASSEFSTDEVAIKGESAKSKYSLEYLQKFIKAAKLTDKAKIQFSNDYPLKLEFSTPRINLFFILAPRVETDN